MLKSVIGVLVCVLLQGCTTKDENSLLTTYDKDKHYHKQLQKQKISNLRVMVSLWRCLQLHICTTLKRKQQMKIS